MKYFIPTGTWPLRIAPYHNLMSKCGFLEGSRETADILLLPGGSDIGNRPERDEAEFLVYREWINSGKPVLGICRGLQVMLYAHNAPMIPHIPDTNTHFMHTTMTGDWRGQSSWHKTRLGLLTNSRHHQGFTAEDIPLSWTVVDHTDDMIVESTESGNQFGVQWHPEHPEMDKTHAQEWWIEKVKSIL